jgi:colanic acid biosynthesis glycosyl transferase WcaI
MWSKQSADQGCWWRDELMNGVKVRRSYLYVPTSPSALKRMAHELSFVISASLNYLTGPRAACTIIVSPRFFSEFPSP